MDSFNSWIRAHGLDEIEVNNRRFTWSNKRVNPTLVRLDRVLVNTDWLLGFAHVSADAIPTVTSDHVPILVQFSHEVNKSNLFRLENHWLVMEDTRKIILEDDGRETWASLELLIINNKHVVEFLNLVEERCLLSSLEMALRQFASAKAEQLILWDESNTFFHAAANGHARRNKIRVIMHEGVEFFDIAQKLQLATNYFSELIGQPAMSLPTVQLSSLYPVLDLSCLEIEFTWSEIVAAINHSPNNRSPGPDGLTNEFYKQFHSTLRPDLKLFFSELYHNRVDLLGINTSFVSLLPKKSMPLELTDFRPISVVHSIPKLASKVLARRLQCQIPHLIHSLQSGFAKGRSIVENFAMATDMVQTAHKRKLPMVVLKLDFRKAFDKVSWQCLFTIMEARGFPRRWSRWVSSLLSTASSRVLINGQLGESFNANKGLRQGDSTSPYLFILVADVLQRLCYAQFEAGNLVHPLGSDRLFPVLQYADDTLLLFQGNLQQANVIEQILTAFSDFSALHINFHKSTLVPVCMDNTVASQIAALFGCPVSSFLCTYLGLPLSLHKIRHGVLLPVIHRVNKRLSGWLAALLSAGVQYCKQQLFSGAHHRDTPLWKNFKQFIPFHRIFLWLAYWDRLNTRDNMAKKQWSSIASHASCDICPAIESFSHIALRCASASALWERFDLLEVALSSVDLLAFLQHAHLHLPASRKLLLLIAAALVTLWHARNDRIFNCKRWSLPYTRMYAAELLSLWNHRARSLEDKNALVCWSQTLLA
nr:uncharacterized protein LOC120969201 [Aegilops tauschii subsp. strangulata]